MEQPSVFTILLLILNIFLLLTAFFGKSLLASITESLREVREDIKRIFDKMDNYQKKEDCQTAHDSHKQIHALEQSQREQAFKDMRNDVNNVANIARKRN